MTLTTRLSLFFLTTLALVLAGFSAALYAAAAVYLHGQSEERLDAALNTLAAAAEVGPDGVEWDPTERRLVFGPEALGGQVAWLVRDDQGRALDRSGPADAVDFLAGEAPDPSVRRQATWQGERWLIGRQTLEADAAARAPTPATPPRLDRDERHYPAVTITAGLSLEPVGAALRLLAVVLAGLSLGIWFAALLVSRAVCRRALRPVTGMAAAARTMDAADLGRRLPAAATGDELEDLSRAFNGLLDRVQEAFERQRRFTGDASHQLRTPLTAMLGQVEVALRRDRPAEDYRQVLATVQRQAERLRRIVESLLFLARADAEAALPDRERLDLRDWLPAQVRSWADHPRAGDVVVDAGDTGPAWADAQPILLGELLNALFDNACKYSPAATPITLRLGAEGDSVTLAVQDHGCGVAEEDLPQLFRPFFRSAEARRRGVEGLGLGLAVAKRLADALGGTLTVVSKPGHGSCFTLRLPRATHSCGTVSGPCHGARS